MEEIRCRIMLCYRNAGAEIAKNFKAFLTESKNYYGYVWYSDQENIGHFLNDIPQIFAHTKYAILFLTKGFTDGFVVDGKINLGNDEYDNGNITVRELIDTEDGVYSIWCLSNRFYFVL